MGEMSGSGGDAMAGMMMPQLAAWSAADWLAMFLMWAVMMVAMMLPSAAPMILLYDRVRERQEAKGASLAATGVFALGYLVAWSGFSLVATSAQWALERAALLTPMLASASPWLGGGLLIAAALYQWSPLKHACLVHCRSPLVLPRPPLAAGARGRVPDGPASRPLLRRLLLGADGAPVRRSA